MFKEIVQGTRLTSGAAESALSHIHGDKFNGDNSMVTTLRALLIDRIPDGETLSFYNVRRVPRDRSASAPVSVDTVKNTLDRWHSSDFEDNSLYFIRIDTGTEEANKAHINIAKEKFVEAYGDGWVYEQKVTDYYIKCFPVCCCYNEGKKTSVVLYSGNNIRTFHFLQAGIIAMIPWYFPRKEVKLETLTDIELELVKVLVNKEGYEKYIEIIGRIADAHDLRTKFIQSALRDFEKGKFKAEADNLRRRCDYLVRDVDEYYRYIREKYAEKSDLEIRLLGLESKIATSGDSCEYMDYFITNKFIDLIEANGCKIKFVARGIINTFDKQCADGFIKNKRSVLYRNFNNAVHSSMEKLYRAIFVDEVFKIRTCGAYFIDGEGGDAVSGFRYDDDVIATRMPNPHIDRYRCIGSYREAINRCIQDGDFVSATEQCIQSVRSLNFADSTVMEEFANRFYDLYKTDKKFIEDADGKIMSIKECIEALQ